MEHFCYRRTKDRWAFLDEPAPALTREQERELGQLALDLPAARLPTFGVYVITCRDCGHKTGGHRIEPRKLERAQFRCRTCGSRTRPTIVRADALA